jgi:hypothetical protein
MIIIMDSKEAEKESKFDLSDFTKTIKRMAITIIDRNFTICLMMLLENAR